MQTLRNVTPLSLNFFFFDSLNEKQRYDVIRYPTYRRKNESLILSEISLSDEFFKLRGYYFVYKNFQLRARVSHVMMLLSEF